MKRSYRVAYAVWSAVAVAWSAGKTASAQEAHFYYPPPQPGSMTITKDVAFAPGDTGKLRMDVYRPSSGEALPTLIFFNGTGLPRSAEIYAGWAKIASFRGLVAIVPDLRPDSAAQDFQKLMAYLTAHAAEYKIDKAGIAVYAALANVTTALPIVEDPRQTAIAAAVNVLRDCADHPVPARRARVLCAGGPGPAGRERQWSGGRSWRWRRWRTHRMRR